MRIKDKFPCVTTTVLQKLVGELLHQKQAKSEPFLHRIRKLRSGISKQYTRLPLSENVCLQVPLLGLLRAREVRRSKEKEFHSLGIPRIPQTSAMRKKKHTHKTTPHLLYHRTIYYLRLLCSCGANFTLVVMNLRACPLRP